MMDNMGPRHDPWNIPIFILLISESVPSTLQKLLPGWMERIKTVVAHVAVYRNKRVFGKGYHSLQYHKPFQGQ